MSKPSIPSPARSDGAAPRRRRSRRTLSVASPARSDSSAKLVSLIAASPMGRRSVLPDDTEIDAPKRASWWKRLEGSPRDVLEALDTNKMPFELLFEEEVEVEKEKQSQSLPASSDNESIASIVVPQKRLFSAKPLPPINFGEMMGSRKSLGKTNLDEDNTIYHLPKNLFNKDKSRNRPVFPSALLNSTNKTFNKTIEPDVDERQGRNLFGQAGTKRKKNMFTDFVLFESDDDSEIQHKVFGFKQNDKRISSGTRKRRMPSLTPSVTTDIDMDDWNLLPSSTMIGNGSGQLEVSRITHNDESEQAEIENQDVTLTEDNHHNTSTSKRRSLNRTRFSKSKKYDDESDKTLTKEDIEVEQASEKLDNSRNKSPNITKSQHHNQSMLSKTRKDRSFERETSKRDKDKSLETEISGKDKEVFVEKTLSQVGNNYQQKQDKNTTDIEASVEDQIAELHGESGEKDKSNQQIEPTARHQKSILEEESSNVNRDEEMEKMAWNDNDDENLNGKVDESNKMDKQDSIREKTSDDEQDNKNDGERDKSNKQDGIHEQTIKEVCHDDEENEHDNEDSHEVNNSIEERISNEDKSNEQDDESNDGSINEPSAEVSDDNNDAEDSENEEMNDEASENNDDQNDVDLSEGVTEDKDDQDVNNKNESEVAVPNNVNAIKSVINVSHKNVESPVDDVIDYENDVVEETPNSSYDTTGQNRKKDVTPVKSPEAVLQNMSKDMSFRPIGRSTSFRKSKIVNDDVNLRHTLIPIQESIAGSDGSRNSSTEGSGWDSHRTTRKTLRQTFGKDFTPRKSLRALVMEKYAKRQTETDKNESKMNKTVNKTVLEDQRIRDKRLSNRNMSSYQLPHTKSPALGISAHHVSDPHISKTKVSYRKSVQEISEGEISNREESINISDRVQAPDDSGPEISMHASYGSGMSAVASHRESNSISVKKGHNGTVNKSTAIKQAPARIEADIQEQEELDYDPSLQEDSTQNYSKADKSSLRNKDAEDEILNREDSTPRISEQMAEKEESEEEHSEPEASDQEIEAESEDEIEAQESEQELEPEESQEEVEPQESEEEIEADESEQDIQVEELEQEESQSEQEMEESDHENSQQEIEAESDREEESDHENSQQEIEVESGREEESDHENSQEENEAESDREESQQVMENESDHDESEQNVSQESVNMAQESDPESDHNSDVPSRGMDSELEFNNQEDSVPIESPSRSSRQTERIVFDNEISDQEMDYELSERVSRQITNDEISERVSEGKAEEEIEYSRHSNQAENLNISIGTKKARIIQNMQKLSQEKMEMRLKIRERVEKSLKQRRDFNRLSPIQSKFSFGRIRKPEQIKPRRKPRKPATLLMGPLPKEFMEDLKYKPPKRFQPANAPWITKHLYKFLESKLEPKYDYRARVRAEALVQNIYNLAKLARRHDVAPQGAVDELKREMARLNIVTTHYDFYEFFHEFMPKEVRVKVNPDIVNKIPKPRNVFADILQAREAVG